MSQTFYLRTTLKSLFLCIFVLLTPPIYADKSWNFAQESDGIRVYTKVDKGNPVRSFKGEVTLETNLNTVIAVLDDTQAYPRWLYNCISAKQLKDISPNETLNYIHTAMPWPAVSRDSIIYSKQKQDPKTKKITIELSSRPEALSKKKGVVRIQNLKGRWILTPTKNGQVKIVYEMNVDPGGNLPKWLVNTMSVDLPMNTLNNLRDMVKEPKYRDAKLESIQEL